MEAVEMVMQFSVSNRKKIYMLIMLGVNYLKLWIVLCLFCIHHSLYFKYNSLKILINFVCYNVFQNN